MTVVLSGGPFGRRGPRVGEVEAFDEVVGLGMVRGLDGRAYPFHCTQIADGSRAIPEGTPVEFEVIPGHLGRWEAAAVRPAEARR